MRFALPSDCFPTVLRLIGAVLTPPQLALDGPVPEDGKWSLTVIATDDGEAGAPGAKTLVQEHSVAIEVAVKHPEFGAVYAQPTGLADLVPFHAQLTEMLGQLSGLSHRLTQQEIVKASADAPTLPVEEVQGKLSIAEAYEMVTNEKPELGSLVDAITAEEPMVSGFEIGAAVELKKQLVSWLDEEAQIKGGTRTAAQKKKDGTEVALFVQKLRGEWSPMIAAAVEQSSQFITEWPHGMGLGKLSELISKFLAAQGGCCALLEEFFAVAAELEEKLQSSDKAVLACKGELAAQATKITELAQLDDLLQELAPYDNIPDNVIVPLEKLLGVFGYGKVDAPRFRGGGKGKVNPSGEGELAVAVNLESRCEDAEDNMSRLTSDVEDKVLECRKQLMATLTEATDWVEKRLEKLTAMEATAVGIEEDVSNSVSASVERYETLSKNVQLAMETFDGKISAVEAESKEESVARNRTKNHFREQTEMMQAENARLAEEVMERLRKIKANEDFLRQAEAADRAAEKTHQESVERYSQHLGALAGCRDEMGTFKHVLSKVRTQPPPRPKIYA